jgi:hypothetical protein
MELLKAILAEINPKMDTWKDKSRTGFIAYKNTARVRVTLRLTVSQSVCLGVEPRLGLMTRYLFE